MSGDYTRHTFRKAKHYSGVRLQQGRVQVDADFNEHVDIVHHVERVTTTDVVGPTGVPEDAPGFAVTAIDGDLLLGSGRAYVDGILVEHEAATPTTLTKISGGGVNTVWEVTAGQRLSAGQWLELDDPPNQFKVTEIMPPQDGDGGRQRLKVSKALGAGTMSVTVLASVLVQPNLLDVILPDTQGLYLAYLDVWEREITALEDRAMKESALGVADTALRSKVIWQVRLLELKDLIAAGAISDPPVCADFKPGWAPDGGSTHTRLAAQTNPTDQDPDPCALPSTGGYRSLENHLYRVEIHTTGQIGQSKVFMKWSSDNAIHRTRLLDVKHGSLEVESAGKDAVTAFKPDDRVEVLDETRILAGDPGIFVRLGEVNDNRLEIKEVFDPQTLQPLTTPANDPDTAVLPRQGLVRRWEGGQPVEAKEGEWIRLEKGIEVQFKAGLATTTDHWLIPARTLKADIEWPADPATGDPAFEPPLGVRHHYAAIALVDLDPIGDWTVVAGGDCRNIFPPLTRLLSMFYVSGDGQEATPDPGAPNNLVQLGEPLIVGVSRGSTPVAGATVRFEVTTGNGRLTGNVVSLEAETDDHGTAEVDWQLDGTTLDQHVTAELLDSAGQRRHLPIIFTGRLSQANEVSFDPSNCAELAGNKTVQLALEALCKLNRDGCATYVVAPNMDWLGVLKGLKPGEDAHVCFQRGRYETKGSVVLKRLGHISLSGVGDGTLIEVSGSETALHFVDCRSVTVSRLRVAAPDGSGVVKHVEHLNGTLTATGCDYVDIHDTSVKCGAGATHERTCITVNSSSKKPIESLRIRDNRLTVGFGQIGILAVDAIRLVVENNELVVAKRPASLKFNVLVREVKRRKKLAKILVGEAILEDKVPSTEKAKTLMAGRFTARFHSAVPESEWRLLMKTDPPKDEDKKSAAAYQRYMNRLVDSVVRKPGLLPSYNRQLTELQAANVDAKVRRGLVVSGKIEVKKFTDLQEEKRNVGIVLDNHRVQYDSPVSEGDWRNILKLDERDIVHSNYELLANIGKSAFRLIDDEQFRNRFSTVRAWFNKLRVNNPSVGYQGIVCGGRTLTEVYICRNSIKGFFEGIHLGVSTSGPAKNLPRIAGTVSICGNRIELRIPMEEKRGRYGIFVGNSRRITIENNELFKTGGIDKKDYDDGIRIWGNIGRFVSLRQNSTQFCITGIHVVAIDPPSKVVWRAIGNLIMQQGGIDVPRQFVRRDNQPPE